MKIDKAYLTSLGWWWQSQTQGRANGDASA